ncbi:universal stress protein [Lentilactobacillus sp. Marseille-Q4993]|uniref:universal stress protein n=1 Tax=Lentilactobacillus sp. Marseille-Q4993 TaxID=3039492 RepID=UPI0024BBEE8D|nr:universal stress protein [Lentilactobacillus sp. Marseille-Q4993]
MFKKILVPMDGSERSKEALDMAIDLALQFKSEIHIVSVVNEAGIYFMSGRPGVTANFLEEQREAASKIVEDAKTYAGMKGVTATTEVTKGMAKQVIAEDYTRENGYDLIVIGKSGADAINRIMMGSTTAYVVRNAKTSVFVV